MRENDCLVFGAKGGSLKKYKLKFEIWLILAGVLTIIFLKFHNATNIAAFFLKRLKSFFCDFHFMIDGTLVHFLS